MKKLVSSLFAALFTIVLVCSTVTNAQTFKDVDISKEYYEAVEVLFELGSFDTTNKFEPIQLAEKFVK